MTNGYRHTVYPWDQRESPPSDPIQELHVLVDASRIDDVKFAVEMMGGEITRQDTLEDRIRLTVTAHYTRIRDLEKALNLAVHGPAPFSRHPVSAS